jgi:phosphoglycolate phosphatase-like HAD superfamily hydrolase
MHEAGVIFDVDGVLLELTRAEEDIFFQSFEDLYGIKGLSRDWDSYLIRNDEKIVEQVLSAHDLLHTEKPRFLKHYLALLETALSSGQLVSHAISGAQHLLTVLAPQSRLGIATANYIGAARLRLEHAGLWNLIVEHAYGADGHGHKRDTVASALAAMRLPRERIVYVGDNLNDLEAAEANGVAFIAFSLDADRRAKLQATGAAHASDSHAQTLTLLNEMLRLDKASNL